MANSSDYEVITGLSIASGTVTPQMVNLQVDADKTCKVVLPDGTTLTSTAGVIDTFWEGEAGAAILIVPKTNTVVTIIGFIGVFTIYSDSALALGGETGITGIVAENTTNIYAANCTNLTSISAPNATDINASGCALTAVAIAAQLAATVANIADLSTVIIDFSGGTNAAYSTWSAQAQADAQIIIAAGGTVTYNA